MGNLIVPEIAIFSHIENVNLFMNRGLWDLLRENFFDWWNNIVVVKESFMVTVTTCHCQLTLSPSDCCQAWVQFIYMWPLEVSISRFISNL